MTRFGAFGLALTALLTLSACGGLPSPDVIEYGHPIDGPSRGFVMYLDSNALTAISARESKAQVTFEVMLVANGQHDTVVPEGTQVDFQVGGSTHQWATAGVSRPISSVFYRSVITQWKLIFEFTADQARTLASEPLSAVRVMLGSGEHLLVLDEDHAATLKRNMGVLSTPRSPEV